MRIPNGLRRLLPAARRLEWYPPYRFLGVRVLELADDWRSVRLLLPLRGNANPGGGMFGGALACVADPVAALSCNRVFPGHQVWTRALALDFRHEGRSDMELRFRLDPGQEQQIGDELARRGRATPSLDYAFFDDRGRACVEVRCRVAIRPGDYRPAQTAHRSTQDDDAE